METETLLEHLASLDGPLLQVLRIDFLEVRLHFLDHVLSREADVFHSNTKDSTA